MVWMTCSTVRLLQSKTHREVFWRDAIPVIARDHAAVVARLLDPGAFATDLAPKHVLEELMEERLHRHGVLPGR